MKRIAALALAFAALLLLTGMGGLGGVPEGTIPDVKEDIAAQLLDRSGTTTELSRVSIDGQLFLEGLRGHGKLSVSLKEIERLEVTSVAGETLSARLTLRGGETFPLTVRKRAVLYGHTGYGAYQIQLRDVQRIDFRP